jgi:hypothetical protein
MVSWRCNPGKVLDLMTDNRFKNFPVDARFTSPGADVRFPGNGQDARFNVLGQDNRFQGESYTGASFAVTLTGLSTDSLGTYGQVGSHASIGFTTTPVITPNEVKWSASASTGAAATFGTGANPTDFTAADGFLVYLHVRRNAEWVTRSFTARRAPGAFGTLANQSFADNTGDQTYVFPAATGTGLTWTYTLVSPPSGVTINSGTRTITFDTNALAVQSGTVITVRAVDQYGRNPGDRAFTLAISLGVNPALSLTAQTAGSGGSPDTVTATYSYSGSDTVDLYVVTTSTATPQTQANIIAGAGGAIIQGDSQLAYAGGTIDLDGFTVNAGVTHIQAVAVERTNGGSSGVQVIAVTSIDFTAPVVSSVATNTAGTQITATFDETILGTNTVGNFSMPGHTLSNMTGTGTTRTFDVSPAVANGDTDTLGYTPGNLTNVRGKALAAFSGQAITNNVPSAGYPSVTGITQGATGFSTTIDVTAPPSNASDDVILVVSVQNGRTISTVPSNFTLVGQTSSDSDPGRCYVYKWDKTGTRPNNNTQTVTISSSGAILVSMYTIAGASSIGASSLYGYSAGTSHQSPSFSASANSIIFHVWAVIESAALTTTFSGATPDTTALSPPDSEGRYFPPHTLDTYHRVWVIQQPSAGTINRITHATSFNSLSCIAFEVVT